MRKERWRARLGWLVAAVVACLLAEVGAFLVQLLLLMRSHAGGYPSFMGFWKYIRLFFKDSTAFRAIANTLLLAVARLLPGIALGWAVADAAAVRPALARGISVAAVLLGVSLIPLQWILSICLLSSGEQSFPVLTTAISFGIVFLVTAAMETAALRLPEHQNGLKAVLQAACLTTAEALSVLPLLLVWRSVYSPHSTFGTFLVPRLVIAGIVAALTGLWMYKREKRRKAPQSLLRERTR